jgi:hypothetical protein
MRYLTYDACNAKIAEAVRLLRADGIDAIVSDPGGSEAGKWAHRIVMYSPDKARAWEADCDGDGSESFAVCYEVELDPDETDAEGRPFSDGVPLGDETINRRIGWGSKPATIARFAAGVYRLGLTNH